MEVWMEEGREEVLLPRGAWALLIRLVVEGKNCSCGVRLMDRSLVQEGRVSKRLWQGGRGQPVLQGGWGDRIWTSDFPGVLSNEEIVVVPLMNGESCHWGGLRGACWGEGWGAGKLELLGGVLGGGCKTVPLSFEVAVELIQFVGPMLVING